MSRAGTADTLVRMTTLEPAAARIDPGRVAALAERQRAIHRERTAGSGRMFERAATVMPGGVPSSFQRNDPWPVYLERGQGSRVWDVDGNEYIDFHNGFGVMCVGHANPVIAAAVRAQMDDGTHFAAPDRGLDRRRRGAAPPLGPAALALHQLRHRVDDGRDPPRPRGERPRAHRQDRGHLPRPPRRRDGLRQAARRRDGRPRAPRPRCPTARATRPSTTDLTRVVPFNDADALERAARGARGQVAGVIMEPAMMNINIVPPVAGYLERVRELTARRTASR